MKTMPVNLAYLAVILIWSTTPLAIKWSAEDVGFAYAAASRMTLGMVLAVLLCLALRARPPLHRRACLVYLASGLGVFSATFSVYWSSQYIPSGWIAVVFGLSPIYTSILASLFLQEDTVGLRKTGSLLFCLAGLYVMFRGGGDPDPDSLYAILALMAGILGYSCTIVAIKAMGTRVRPLFTMTGTLVITAGLYTLVWQLGGATVPYPVPFRATAAILYLGVIGSVVSFMLFYFMLQHVQATRAALITLITPGCALLIGNLLNAEPLTVKIITGAGMVLCGLLLFEFSDAISRTVKKLVNEISAAGKPFDS